MKLSLDSQTEARRGVASKLACSCALANPGMCFAYDPSGVYALHQGRVLMFYSWAITGALVDLSDSPRDVTDYTNRAALFHCPPNTKA